MPTRSPSRLTIALGAAIGLAACASRAATPVPTTQVVTDIATVGADSVVVRATSARLVVPFGRAVPERWHWNATGTADNQLEYEWSVTVAGARGNYMLGFRLFKYPDARPDSGGIADLVRAGQVDVALEEGGTGVARRTTLPLGVRLEPTRLVFELRDSAAVAEVFGRRPARAEVTRRLGSRDLPSESVAIVYAPGASVRN